MLLLARPKNIVIMPLLIGHQRHYARTNSSSDPRLLGTGDIQETEWSKGYMQSSDLLGTCKARLRQVRTI